MKLILKHLLHSIRKKPTQPLIIILTLALSVAMTIFALTIYDSLTTDAEMAQASEYGSADFTVELGGSSDSRFLFASDIRDALGDRATAAGVYPLPLILNGTFDTASGVATELDSVGDLFSIGFIEYGSVTHSSLTEIAFVSADFAEQRGIALGDTISVETMGHQRSYRIEGISANRFMESYDVMVDIGSVMRAFADKSLLFAAIGDDFKPCSKVYVDVLDDSASLGAAIDVLKADTKFEGYRFTDVRGAENTREYIEYLEVFISVAVTLTMLLAGIVTFCCFFILANQRQEENFSLSCCGAGPQILGLMQYAEVIIYFLIGAPLGVLISIPTVQAMALFVGLSYAKAAVSPTTALIGVLILLAVCILTVSLFLAFAKRTSRTGERKHRAGLTIPLILVGVMAVLLGVLYIIPVKFAFTVYCIQLATLIVFLFFATSPLLQRFALFLERIMRKAKSERAISFRYAVKNVSSLKMLHNISMLCALATLTAFTVGIIFISLVAELRVIPKVIAADYTVFNATDRCYEKLEACEEADTVSKFYMSMTSGVAVVSAQDISVYSPILNISQAPEGNEVVFSKGVARKMSLDIGDVVDLELDGVQYSFFVTDIVETCTGFIAINCEDVGIPYNSIVVKGDAGVARADLLAALSEATVTELAPIQETETLFENVIDTMDTYLRAAIVLLFVFIVFFVIGTLDALFECIRARGEDFGLYRLAGLSKKQLTLMRVTEVSLPIVFGILLGILVAVVSLISINRGMASFGMIPFIVIKTFIT